MSEKHRPPQAPQNKESFQHKDEVQFRDGKVGLEYKTPGDVVRWGMHKYANPDSRADCIIVTTASAPDKRHMFALGSGVAVMLPKFDKETATFGKAGDTLHAADLREIAPQGLPEVVIGEPWAITEGMGTVQSVLLDYKDLPHDDSAEQAPFDNPFDSAREHIQRVESQMHQ